MKKSPRTTRLGDLVTESGFFSSDIVVTLERFEASGRKPEVSFIVPIYNQEQILLRNLTSIASCSVLPAEVILVCDACTDGSEVIARTWAARAVTNRANITSVTVAACSEEIFETNCDNLGASIAEAPYLVEVQSDMFIEQVGFDALLIDTLRKRPDLIAISARGAHGWDDVIGSTGGRLRRYADKLKTIIWQQVISTSSRNGRYQPSPWSFKLSHRVGRLNELVDLPLSLKRDGLCLYLGETVMRGPLAIDAGKFRELSGFDGHHFFLGNDDHDLMARAWTMRRWRCGYLPIAFSSPLSEGITRQEKTLHQKRRFQEVSSYYASRYSTSALARLSHDFWSRPRCAIVGLDSSTTQASTRSK